jgi:MtN3 and saliva related transmembrane protein
MIVTTIAPWLVESFGSAAAVCTTICYVPQLVRVWKRKSAEDLSLAMFLLFSVGEALWLIYGLCIHSFPVIAANVATLVLALMILFLKLRYAAMKPLPEAGVVGPEVAASGKIEI